MFEPGATGWGERSPGPAPGLATVPARVRVVEPAPAPASTAQAGSRQLTAMAARLRELAPAETEAENVERIRLLEELKAVCAAVQAQEAVALHAARSVAEAGRGVPSARRCRGVGAEVALARGESPARGSRHLGLALALVHEMPHTMAALTAGTVSEWRATLIARETAWLPADGRRHVDHALAGQLVGRGDRAVAAQARALAQAYDPYAATEHLRRAERERRVSIRPAPDAMVHLSALLPMVQGVAAYAALGKAASAALATGEASGRTRAQVMADLVVERLTGQHAASAVPVEVHLVMTDASLLSAAGDVAGEPDGGDLTSPDPRQAPAWLVGYGPVPAPAARSALDPAFDHPDGRARVWLRRLFARPESGQLAAMDSRRRTFDGDLRRLLLIRDDTCRTPWCDAPVRHVDHATPHRSGGPTAFSNGSSLCERCNHTKEADDWRHTAGADGLAVTTPTGHSYTAPARPLLPSGLSVGAQITDGGSPGRHPDGAQTRTRGRGSSAGAARSAPAVRVRTSRRTARRVARAGRTDGRQRRGQGPAVTSGRQGLIR